MDYKKELEEVLVEIQKSYEKRSNLLKSYLEAKNDMVTAKMNLENRKAEGILNGQIEGKNEMIREAVAKSLLITEYTTAEKLNLVVNELQIDLDLESMKYSFLKDKYTILISLNS